jgi:alpha-amylase
MVNAWKTVTVATAFGANTQLHDYSGHAGDVWTDSQGNATIGIPPNNNGSGYVCYSRANSSHPNSVRRFACTQVFEGAADLDIGPAGGGQTLRISRIWCDAGFPIALTLESDAANLTFKILDPQAKELPLAQGQARTQIRGWHTLTVDSTAAETKPFKIRVTYTSTQQL